MNIKYTEIRTYFTGCFTRFVVAVCSYKASCNAEFVKRQILKWTELLENKIQKANIKEAIIIR